MHCFACNFCFALRIVTATLALAVSLPCWATPRMVVAMDQGGGSVHVMDPDGIGRVFDPYGPMFRGGVSVAVADLSGDGVAEVITGSGAGIPAELRIFDGVSLQPMRAFRPYGDSFMGGIFIGAGDVNGDGRADLIVGAGTHGIVRIFDGRTGSELRTFTAFAEASGGVRVAAGDINGDGADDIIIGLGSGGPVVKVFDGLSGAQHAVFDAFSLPTPGGVTVAAGDIDGDGRSELVVGRGADPIAIAGAHVKVFSGNGATMLADFHAYDPAFTGGVRVATADINGDGRADILTTPGVGGAPFVHRWLAPQMVPAGQVLAFTPSFAGGVFVGATVVVPTVLRDGFEE